MPSFLIIGNCWKSLYPKERAHWEQAAEKAKQDHKRRYPDYRFQPKHDPEKKKRRQAAREAARAAAVATDKEKKGRDESVGGDETSLDLMPESRSTGQSNKMGRQQQQQQQVRVPTNFYLGHRRSSSVPLPTEAYQSYHFSAPFAQAPGISADPFNFANPALAQAPSGQPSGGIALPSLPSDLNSYHSPSPWPQGNVDGVKTQHISGLGMPQAMTMSRAASPIATTTGTAFSGLSGFSGMSSMGLGLGGMGARAAHTHQLGQLGRRASSTQPSLSHQLNSGSFNNFDLNSYPNTYTPQSFDPNQQFPSFDLGPSQQQPGSGGFVGAVAEPFTNPFAPSQSHPSQSNPGSAGGPGGMWYDMDSVDPMTPVYSQTSHPQYASSQLQTSYSQGPSQSDPGLPGIGSTLINPTFSFGSAPKEVGHGMHNEIPSSSKSISPSTSAPQTGARDSFDMSGFGSALSSSQNAQVSSNTDIPPHALLSHQTSNEFPLAQPIPIRKTATNMSLESAETHHMYGAGTTTDQAASYPTEHGHGVFSEQYSGLATGACGEAHVYHPQGGDVVGVPPDQSYYAHAQPQYNAFGDSTGANGVSGAVAGTSGSGQTSDGSASGGNSSAEGSPRYDGFRAHDQTAVTSFELLDGAVDVSHMVSDVHGQQHQQQSYAQQHQQQHQGYIQQEPSTQAQMYGVSAYGGYDVYSHSQEHQTQEGHGHGHDGSGPADARFSFSDYIHGSPFVATSAIAN